MLALRKSDFNFNSSDRVDNASTFEVALQGGDVVNAVEELRNSVIKGVVVATGLMIVGFVLFFVVVPAGYVAGFWFSRKRSYLIKYMRKTPVDLANSNQYVMYKTHVERLYKRHDVLKEVASLELRKVPVIVRFPVRKMRDISSTLLTYQEWLNSRLNMYNQEQFKSDNKIFSFKSESDLWNSRNKAYAYWM